MGKSSRVADEDSIRGGGTVDEAQIFVRDGGNAGERLPLGISVLYGVLIRAPLSILSACFVQPRVSSNGADGAWTSGDFARASEMNQLVVSDSIRYALLM